LHAAPPPPNLGFGVFGNGAFDYGGAQLTLPPPGAPLFTGVNLTELGVSFALHPTTFTGDATISVADGEVTVHGTALVTFANPNDPFTYQGQLPGVANLRIGSMPITSFAAGISGTVTVNDVPGLGSVPLANGYVFYISPGYFEFAGGVSQDLAGIVQVNGGVNGALDLNSGLYNLAGNIQACANFPGAGQICAGLNAIVSSAGIGACGNLPPFTFGFRYTWGASLPDLLGPFGCDLGPITVVVSPARDVAHASSARPASPLSVSLPGGLPSTTMWATGADGPPQVTITGPHGERLSNPAPGRAVESPDLVIWPEPKLNETLIGIRHPSAGRWTITPLPDSPSITGLKYADGLPAANIRATVAGDGQVLRLRYRIRARAGQTVTFAERAGGAIHVIGRASGSRGSLVFKPVAQLARRREIVAMISLAGVPRQNLVVGGYTAPSAPRPVTPSRVHVLQAGSAVTVNWLPADRWGCLVVATLSDGRRLLYSMPPMRHSLRISRLAPGIGARITVTDLGQTGNTSAGAVATLTPHHPSRATGLTVRRLDRRVMISWRPAADATRYLVTVTVRGRTPVTLFGITAQPAMTLIKAAHYLLASGDVSQISVRAVNAAGQPGPAAIARLTG
jgi:hypothetical protein